MARTRGVAVSSWRCGAVLLTASTAIAQATPSWRQLPPIGPFLTLATYEEPNGAFVALGGDAPGVRAWRWAGGWQEIVCATAPSVRAGAAVAYDQARGVAVLFGGGEFYQPLDDTWEFDGSAWTLRAPALSPGPRTAARISYDLVRQRCVLFGGLDTGGQLTDTWEYDGNTWIRVATLQTPPPMLDPGMCFDVAHARTMLVGDLLGPTPAPCQTWLFDGSAWQQLPTANAPSSRSRPRLAYDPSRQQAVLFGGLGNGPFGTTMLDDTWVFDGTDWTQVTTSTTPPGRYSMDATWSSLAQGVVAFGGSYYGAPRSSAALHVFDGSDWIELLPDAPFHRNGPLLAFDAARDVLVLHGGIDEYGAFQQETWEWHGSGWQRTATGTGPGVSAAGMTYDLARQRVVALDGATTWQYDVNGWVAQTLPPTPTAGALCYDRHVGAVRVAAGAQLWTFDGGAWTSTTTIGAAPTGAFARATHWSAGERIVAASGFPYSASAFDGASWTPIATNSSPGTALAEDALRGVLVAIGINPPATYLLRSPTATWQAIPAAPHEEIWNVQVVGDAASGTVLGVTRGGQVWRLEWPGQPSFARFGAGCAGSAGVPHLTGLGALQPYLGQPLPLALSGLPLSPGLGVLVWGTSITSTAAAPLPIPLGAIGLPGCALWTTPVLTTSFAHGGAQVTFLPTLPQSLSLAGSVLTAQAFVLDLQAGNGLGSVSNAVIAIPY